MKHCAHCQKENRDEAQFCGHCGQAFVVSRPQTPEGENLQKRLQILERQNRRLKQWRAVSVLLIGLGVVWIAAGPRTNERTPALTENEHEPASKAPRDLPPIEKAIRVSLVEVMIASGVSAAAGQISQGRFSFENRSGKEIRELRGVIRLTDSLLNEGLAGFRVRKGFGTFPAGGTRRITVEATGPSKFEFPERLGEHRAMLLRTKDWKRFSLTWTPELIVFADDTVLKR